MFLDAARRRGKAFLWRKGNRRSSRVPAGRSLKVRLGIKPLSKIFLEIKGESRHKSKNIKKTGCVSAENSVIFEKRLDASFGGML